MMVTNCLKTSIKWTVASATALLGSGPTGCRKGQLPHTTAQTHSYVASFAEVEVDLETGKYHILDFLAYADVGTVIHPRAPGADRY